MHARSQTPKASPRLRAISAVALVLLAVLVTSPSEAVAQDAWQPLSAADVRFGHSALYDAAAREMTVLVGAESLFKAGDPLSLDLTAGTWAPLDTAGQVPEPRAGRGPVRGSGMVGDADERIALLECDCDGGSTYFYDMDDKRWSLAPNDSEIRVVGGAMVYDSVGDRAVLVGGRQYGISAPITQTQSYDLSDERAGWQPLPSAPFAAADASAAFVEGANHVVVFGGQTDDGVFLDRLWLLELSEAGGDAVWRDVTATAGPGPTGRVGASLVSVPQRQTVVLYGGYAPGQTSGDVWMLDYSVPSTPRWVLVMPESPGPGARAAHSAIWDAAGEQLVVYGGTRGEGGGLELLTDAWALPADALVAGPTPTLTPVPSLTPTSSPDPTESPDGPLRLWLPVAYRPASGH